MRMAYEGNTVQYSCSHCGGVWVPMVLHPAVASFFHGHDIRYFDAVWDLIRTGFAGETELLSVDPVRLRITLMADDSELRVTIDDGPRIVDLNELE